MNAIQKAAFAASALVVTLMGTALVTAPMGFARTEPVAAHHACTTPNLQLTLAGHIECTGASPTQD